MKVLKFYNSGTSRKSNKANKGPFFIDSVKNKGEGELLIPPGTFFQSWLALYAVLSKTNFFVLGF